MKITLAQINPIVGDIDGNKEKIIAAAQQSKGSSLVVFPELSLCGFPPYNLLGYSDFIERCEKAVDEIAERCDTIPLLIGAPVRNTSGKGKPLFNAAVFLHQGKRQIFKKKNIGFDNISELNHFEPTDETRKRRLGLLFVLGGRLRRDALRSASFPSPPFLPISPFFFIFAYYESLRSTRRFRERRD